MPEGSASVTRLKAQYPEEILDVQVFRDEVTVWVKRDRIKEVLSFLRDDPTCAFSMLKDLTAVDWLGKKEPRFEIVYLLFNMDRREHLRVKVPVGVEDFRLPTVSDLWKVGNWLEREAYDMFGVRFDGHPGLKRILMPGWFREHPLRKDEPYQRDLLADYGVEVVSQFEEASEVG